jgi:hypothetical protein
MLKEKQGREEKEKDKGKGKQKEDEENELTHCFGTGFFPWKYGRHVCGDPKDEACSSLKQTLLTPQQSKSTPTPSDAPNPIIADATAMTMRISKPKAKVCILCQCKVLGRKARLAARLPTYDRQANLNKR